MKVCAKLETESKVLDKFRKGSRPNFLFFLNGEQAWRAAVKYGLSLENQLAAQSE